MNKTKNISISLTFPVILLVLIFVLSGIIRKVEADSTNQCTVVVADPSVSVLNFQLANTEALEPNISYYNYYFALENSKKH